MTNEELFDDLKQFITTTVSQSEERLSNRIEQVEARMATKDDLKSVEDRLNKRVDDVQGAVGDAITQMTDARNWSGQ
jgi:chaperonin cofactor prefoldin